MAGERVEQTLPEALILAKGQSAKRDLRAAILRVAPARLKSERPSALRDKGTLRSFQGFISHNDAGSSRYGATDHGTQGGRMDMTQPNRRDFGRHTPDRSRSR
jgi:hypothetical protein